MPEKRALLLFSGKCRGSMALEGSLALPLFLFYMMTVLLGLEAIRFQSDVQQALHQAGNRKAFMEYQVKYLGAAGVDVQEQVKGYLGNQYGIYLLRKADRWSFWQNMASGHLSAGFPLEI